MHNQHLINIHQIKKFAKDNGGYLIMHGKPDITIPIARSRKDDFLNFLKFRGIVIWKNSLYQQNQNQTQTYHIHIYNGYSPYPQLYLLIIYTN